MKTLGIPFALGIVSATFWAAQDPFEGTWKLNPARSASTPGPTPEVSVMKIEARENGIKVIRDLSDSAAAAGHWEFTASFDGKDYAVANDPTRDTVALKRVDAYTLHAVNKKNGKVNSAPQWVVSRDGKTLTIRWQGTNAQDQATTNVRVYDKQ